jgi:HD-GYP domain-containing protein (c-di-GMP phosphodiesterase class II)
MIVLARVLGLGGAACRTAGLAGRLHEVGKARMPIGVLDRPGTLTDAESRFRACTPSAGSDC